MQIPLGQLHTKDKGDLAETQVLAELKRLGYGVSVPFGDNLPYDMIVDSEGSLHRVQVKYSRYKDGKVVFTTKSSNSNTKECWYNTYEDKADWFIVYNAETERCYAVTVSEAGSSSMSLRVEEPKSSSPNINWARDYTLTKNTF